MSTSTMKELELRGKISLLNKAHFQKQASN